MTVFLLLAVSCGKGWIDTPVPDDGDDPWTALTGDCPITFASAVAGPATKATSPLPSGTSFGVFAFYQPGTIGGAPGAWGDGSLWTPNFMYNQKVVFDGTAYSYTPLKYWPNNEENTITFWAYCPYEDEDTVDPCIDRFRVINSATTYSPSAHGIPNIQYTTDGHTDFLVADPKYNQHHRDEGDPNLPNNPDATVYFTFKHAMSWVDFTVRKQDPDNNYNMVLKSLRIDGIYFSGVYNQGLGWIATSGGTGSIAVYTHDPLNPLVLHHPDPLDPSTDPVQLPKAGDDEIMPLPQYLKWTDASLHVEYTLALGESSPTEYELDVPLGSIHDEWERNKHYTYQITINPGNPIMFTATVTTWDAEEEVYYYFE